MLQFKVWFRFEPLTHCLNSELDFWFGSAILLNFELNFGFSSGWFRFKPKFRTKLWHHYSCSFTFYGPRVNEIHDANNAAATVKKEVARPASCSCRRYVFHLMYDIFPVEFWLQTAVRWWQRSQLPKCGTQQAFLCRSVQLPYRETHSRLWLSIMQLHSQQAQGGSATGWGGGGSEVHLGRGGCCMDFPVLYVIVLCDSLRIVQYRKDLI